MAINPLVPIAGAAALFLLMGRRKKEEEVDQDDSIEEPPLGDGDGDGYADGYGADSASGNGGGVGAGGITIDPSLIGTGKATAAGGLGTIPTIGIQRGTATGGSGRARGSTKTRGGKAPRPTKRVGTPKLTPTVSIQSATKAGSAGGSSSPPTPPEDTSERDDVEESIERQEEVKRQQRKDSNLMLCQKALFALGAGKAPSGQWGYYNDTTEGHLKAFQAKYGLEQTGVCDIETKRELGKQIQRRSSPKFCFGQDECNEYAEKALYSATSLYIPLKTDPNTGETLEGAFYRVGPNEKVYYEAYEASIGISPVLTGAWPYSKLPWVSRYAIEKKIDRTGGDTWEVGKTIENEIFAGRVPGPGEKFGA